MKRLKRLGLPLLLAIQMGGAIAAPDENLLGKEAGYPIGTANTFGQDRFKVGTFTAMDSVRLPPWIIFSHPTQYARGAAGSTFGVR